MEDFPAAHSMDTEWFAVDRDGCVGVFWSSDGGAVPQAIPSPANNWAPAAPRWSPEETDLDGVVPVVSREELDRLLEDHDWGPQLFFPRDARSFARCRRILQQNSICGTVPLRDGRALFLTGRPSLPARLLLALKSYGVWRALPNVAGWWPARLWACGFVCYWPGGPDGALYHRHVLLPHSVSLAHLPADAVARVSIVRLDCSFRETESIQPCTHVACLGYQNDEWSDEHGIHHESGLEEAWRARAGG